MSEINEEKINESNDVFQQASAACGQSENVEPGMNNPAFFPAETTSPFVFPPTQKPVELELDGSGNSEKKKKRKPKKPPKVPKRQSPPDSG